MFERSFFSSLILMHRLPPVVAFDLDGTVWAPEMYELFGGGGSPFEILDSTRLKDRQGTQVHLLGDTHNIMNQLSNSTDTVVAVASRTDEPSWAIECMKKFKLPNNKSLFSLCTIQEIYKGSKKKHLAEIMRKTGHSASDILFFDNEIGNINDAKSMGVIAVFCPQGVTADVWEKGLLLWQNKK